MKYTFKYVSNILDKKPSSYKDIRLKKATSRAKSLLRSEDWENALTQWKHVLELSGNNQSAKNRAKLYISVLRRLVDIEAYKNEISRYVTARADTSPVYSRSPSIAIYTAISGNYDSLKLPEVLDDRFEYFVFTDTPSPETGVWQVRPITYFHEDPTRSARFVKTHPHMLLPDYDIAVWIDSNILILDDIYPLIEGFLESGKAVAAVPHPKRQTVYEEIEACLELNKDEAEVLQEQRAHFKASGFAHADLIESNFIMFDLQNSELASFLTAWWREIDRYSKRDQLSLNYALAETELEWHRLTEHPNSIRNHPEFALMPHDGGNGPAQKLIEALQAPLVDPYAGPTFSEVRTERIAAQQGRRIDVIVCVHNALEDVRQCLESIQWTRTSEYQRLILIDDGSSEETARYLETFAEERTWVDLHRNDSARGYTKAANQGLNASTGEFVILLNSDTIVTDSWAAKMADAVFSTPGAGIVGPLSNAASHQSIPDHRSSKDQTAINKLPPRLSAEDVNRYCEEWTTANVLPRTPLIHGFCFGITRSVLYDIGNFDEVNFPKGYGEENSYCFRAIDSGFSLVVATHTFIYHAKSKSYVDPERIELMKAGNEALRRLHGRSRIRRAVKSMQNNPLLQEIRQRAGFLYH